MVCCGARECRNRSEEGYRMMLVPTSASQQERRTQWLKNMGREKIPNPKLLRICEVHFTEDCWWVNDKGKKHLFHDAVPTIFHFNKSPCVSKPETPIEMPVGNSSSLMEIKNIAEPASSSSHVGVALFDNMPSPQVSDSTHNDGSITGSDLQSMSSSASPVKNVSYSDLRQRVRDLKIKHNRLLRKAKIFRTRLSKSRETCKNIAKELGETKKESNEDQNSGEPMEYRVVPVIIPQQTAPVHPASSVPQNKPHYSGRISKGVAEPPDHAYISKLLPDFNLLKNNVLPINVGNLGCKGKEGTETPDHAYFSKLPPDINLLNTNKFLINVEKLGILKKLIKLFTAIKKRDDIEFVVLDGGVYYNLKLSMLGFAESPPDGATTNQTPPSTSGTQNTVLTTVDGNLAMNTLKNTEIKKQQVIPTTPNNKRSGSEETKDAKRFKPSLPKDSDMYGNVSGLLVNYNGVLMIVSGNSGLMVTSGSTKVPENTKTVNETKSKEVEKVKSPKFTKDTGKVLNTKLTKDTVTVDNSKFTKDFAKVENSKFPKVTVKVKNTKLTKDTVKVDSKKLTKDTAKVDSKKFTKDSDKVDNSKFTKDPDKVKVNNTVTSGILGSRNNSSVSQGPNDAYAVSQNSLRNVKPRRFQTVVNIKDDNKAEVEEVRTLVRTEWTYTDQESESNLIIEEKAFYCSYCDFLTVDKLLLFDHISRTHDNSLKPADLKHRTDVPLSKDLKVVSSKEFIKEDRSMSFERRFQCGDCPFSTLRYNVLRMHRSNFHKKLNFDGNKCRETGCKFQSASVSECIEHSKLHKMVKNIKISSGGKYKVVSKNASGKDDFMNHLRLQTGTSGEKSNCGDDETQNLGDSRVKTNENSVGEIEKQETLPSVLVDGKREIEPKTIGNEATDRGDVTVEIEKEYLTNDGTVENKNEDTNEISSKDGTIVVGNENANENCTNDGTVEIENKNTGEIYSYSGTMEDGNANETCTNGGTVDVESKDRNKDCTNDGTIEDNCDNANENCTNDGIVDNETENTNENCSNLISEGALENDCSLSMLDFDLEPDSCRGSLSVLDLEAHFSSVANSQENLSSHDYTS